MSTRTRPEAAHDVEGPPGGAAPISRRAFLGLAGAALLAAGTASTRSAAAAPGAYQPRSLGAMVGGYPGASREEGEAALLAWRQKTGYLPESVLTFERFGEYDIGAHKFAAAHALGVVPTVTLEPYEAPLREIFSGLHDAWLGRLAATVAAAGGPVRVRFAHEMNGGWYPWGEQPEAYRAAFARVAGILKGASANARTVFAPNVVGGAADDPAPYYPGPGYADWLALDGYDQGYGAQAPAELFGPSYDGLVSLDPAPGVMISETATGEGAHKPAWVRDLFFSAVPERLPRVLTVLWFDTRKEQDWRVDSSPEALAAYAEALGAYRGWRGAW